MSTETRVLSLFDGCAGARQALDRLNVPCKYYASEIDKYAIAIALKNYPDIMQIGDVTTLTENNLPKDIDLLVAGFPCQSLSCAASQKESGLIKGKSVLFWELIRIFRIVKPKYFLFENVASMKASDRDEISRVVGVDPVKIDSSLLTAQSRKRLYWTNIPNIEQPPDIGLKLQDVLESPDDYTDRLKSYCITATYSKASGVRDYKRAQRQMVFCVASRGRYDENGIVCQKIEPRKDNKTNALTTVLKDNLIEDTANCTIRKLTPIECERLQGMKDNYTEGVSRTQRYKMIGNGFTIPVIAWILKGIFIDGH